MEIGVIGGGAIGLLFSSYLSKVHRVTLFTRTEEQAALINETGIILVDGDIPQKHSVESKPISLWNGSFDLVFISLKEYQLADLMPLLKKQGKNARSLFFLQNGMGHLKYLSDLESANIYIGSVEHGAARINANTVSHNGHGVTRSAVYKGSEVFLRQFAAIASEFPFTLEQDYKKMLENKLLVNAVINPLTAVLRVTNGTLLANPFYYKMAVHVFEEAAKILKIHNKAKQFENVLSVCKKTSNNQSSMFKDIENGRKTEIEAILGYLLEEANREQIDAPLLSNYYYAIKGIEHQRGEV